MTDGIRKNLIAGMQSVESVGIVDTSFNTWRRLLTFESNHHLPFTFVFS